MNRKIMFFVKEYTGSK